MKRILFTLCIVVVFNFLVQNVCADELSELKAQVKNMQKTIDEGLKKPLFVKIGHGDLTISGFVQALYRHYQHQLDSANDSFRVPRARLKLDGNVIDDFGYRIQVDVASSSSILRDAYIRYTKYPFANVIVGQTLIPFSEEQLSSPTNFEFIDLTTVTSALSYDRDIGVKLEGELFDKRLSYGAGIFNGSGINRADNNNSKDVVTRVVISPFKGKNKLLAGLSLGAAFQYGKQPRVEDAEGNRTVIGALAKYEYNKLKIQSEYLFRRQEQIPGLSDKDACGWYIMTAYYFLPKLQAAARYEEYDPNRDVSRNKEDILTLGLNYFFNDYLRLQTNYRFKNDQSEASSNDFALQLTISY